MQRFTQLFPYDLYTLLCSSYTLIGKKRKKKEVLLKYDTESFPQTPVSSVCLQVINVLMALASETCCEFYFIFNYLFVCLRASMPQAGRGVEKEGWDLE